MHFNSLQLSSSLMKPYKNPGDMELYFSGLYIDILFLKFIHFFLFDVIIKSRKILPKTQGNNILEST